MDMIETFGWAAWAAWALLLLARGEWRLFVEMMALTSLLTMVMCLCEWWWGR